MQAEIQVDARDVVELSVDERGRVTIPQTVRERHGLVEGDVAEIVVVGAAEGTDE